MALALALAPLPAPAQRALPALGEGVSQTLSVGAERRLGDQIMRELRRDTAYLDDPPLRDHVRALWQRLLGAARQRGDLGTDIDEAFAWELFLVRDRAINAFALPGGYVGLHLGLIASTASTDELASVLAHELSHVTQRHIARGIGQAERQGSVGVAALILGALLASRMNSPDLAQAAIAGSQAAVLQGQLNFSRDMEREADRIGWAIHQQAGFTAQGVASMFDRLDQAARLNDSGSFPYLRSHPLTTERLAEARSRLVPGTSTSAALAPADRAWSAHALMQGRARVLMDPSTSALKRLVALADAESAAAPTPSAAYAGALAALSLGDAVRASAGVQSLWNALPSAPTAEASAPHSPEGVDAREARVVVALLGVEIARLRQDPAQAQQWMALADRHATQTSDGGRLLPRARLMARAEVALMALGNVHPSRSQPTSGPLAEASSGLRSWLSEQPSDASAWAMLARVERAQGQGLRAARAQAESQAALGDLDAAIEVLRAAQAATRAPRSAAGSTAAEPFDFIEASVIDARLRQWLALRQQRAADSRGSNSGSR